MKIKVKLSNEQVAIYEELINYLLSKKETFSSIFNDEKKKNAKYNLAASKKSYYNTQYDWDKTQLVQFLSPYYFANITYQLFTDNNLSKLQFPIKFNYVSAGSAFITPFGIIEHPEIVVGNYASFIIEREQQNMFIIEFVEFKEKK